MIKYRNDKEKELLNNIRNEVLNGLHNHLKELKAHEIKCEIQKCSENEGSNEAIIGTYKNEPFCVYYLKMIMSNGEYVSMVMTRWKGKDHRIKKPLDVLTGS